MSGINASQWFYGTSFHSSEPPEQKTESGLRIIPAYMAPARLHVLTVNGQLLACRCGMALYWDSVDNELRAECCGRVHHERIRQ